MKGWHLILLKNLYIDINHPLQAGAQRVRLRAYHFMIKYLLMIVLSALYLSSCKSARQSAPPAAAATIFPQIIFLNFKIQSDSVANTESAWVINHIITPGKLKQHIAAEAPTMAPNSLVCSFRDAAMRPLRQIILEDPLRRSVEFAEQNGQLTTRIIRLSEAEFSLRTQLEPGSVFIVLEKIINPEQNKTITLLKYNLPQS